MSYRTEQYLGAFSRKTAARNGTFDNAAFKQSHKNISVKPVVYLADVGTCAVFSAIALLQ